MGVKRARGGDISTDIEEFQNTYGWINCTLFMGEPLSVRQIEDEVSKSGKPEDELDALTSQYQRKVIEKEKLLSEITEDRELSELVTFFGETVYYRTVRLEWMNQGCFRARPLIKEVARRMGESLDSCIYYTFDEVVHCLKEGKKIASEEIRERLRGYALISDDTVESLLLTGKALLSFKSVLSQSQEKDIEHTLFKGVTASRGMVKGLVRIVRDRSEIQKVYEGDVLVTPLTTPDFLMAMKKSVAIITDLGGITSHAAIVARELGLPCVVGTKIATQVLKDGDLVEVDADNGVVRILEKAT